LRLRTDSTRFSASPCWNTSPTTQPDHATAHLLLGGHLIVLAPAHPYPVQPNGHSGRPPTRLRALTPPDCRRDHPRHLDAAGFFASLANRLPLHASRQSPGQVSLWDDGLVPTSRILDPLLGHRFGRSRMAVWRRAR
jgi:hypothetical protein